MTKCAALFVLENQFSFKMITMSIDASGQLRHRVAVRFRPFGAAHSRSEMRLEESATERKMTQPDLTLTSPG